MTLLANIAGAGLVAAAFLTLSAGALASAGRRDLSDSAVLLAAALAAFSVVAGLLALSSDPCGAPDDLMATPADRPTDQSTASPQETAQ